MKSQLRIRNWGQKLLWYLCVYKSWLGQYRSNLTALIKIISTSNFKSSHLKALSTTPFWIFFEAFINGYCSESTCTKSDDDVYRLLGRFEKATCTFNIGGKQLTFSADDISLIFGIRSGNVPLEIGQGTKPLNIPFVDRRFPNVDRLLKTVLEDKLNEALQGEKRKIMRMLHVFLYCWHVLRYFFHNGDNNQMDIHGTCWDI